MKIGIFTDSHYSSQEVTCGKRYNNKSLAKIRKAYAQFEAEGCDLAVCLGDLTDADISVEKEVENLKQIAEVFNHSPIPTVCVMGNHDAFAFTVRDFYTVLGGHQPENRTVDGKTLVFLDACYFKNGQHYMPGDSDWTDTYLPEIAAFEKTLAEAEGDVYIFLHQNIDPAAPENHRLFNAETVMDIIEKSGKVKTVFQGHYHTGARSIHNGVQYITFPAMCENENAHFILDIE